MSITQPMSVSFRAGLSTLFLALAGFLAAPSALAQANGNPPERMTYQGFLVDGNGTALATNAPKNYDIVFRIWNDASASSAANRLWTEQQTVTVDKGNFSILLGEGTAIGGEAKPVLSAIFTNGTASERYVEMTVKGIGTGGVDLTMLPRLRLLTTPYAFLASKVAGVAGAVPDAGLSANVALRNGGNNFVGNQVVDGIIQARTATPANGYIAMQAGSASNAGYLEIFKPGPTRIGYLGFGASGPANVGLNLESSANFNINGGNVGIGLGTVRTGPNADGQRQRPLHQLRLRVGECQSEFDG